MATLLITIGTFLVVSILELRFLFRHNDKKEAAIYLCLIAFTLGLAFYVSRTPDFYGFAKMMNDLFRVR